MEDKINKSDLGRSQIFFFGNVTLGTKVFEGGDNVMESGKLVLFRSNT